MKKIAILWAIIGALAVLGVASILLVRGVFGASPAVGVVDGIRFNVRPSEVSRKLGNPIQVVDNMDRFETVEYVYITKMFDVDTEVTFSFVDNTMLTKVFGIVSLTDVDDIANLVESWYQRLFFLYKDSKGFYFDEEPVIEEESEILCLGTENGAGGLTCFIEKGGDTLRIVVEFME